MVYWCVVVVFFFKQKTAYEMRISDWSSDVCSSDLAPLLVETVGTPTEGQAEEDVSRATVQALRQRGPAWLPGNFTASPVDAGNGPYRLRIAYAMPLAFDRQRVCKTGTDTPANMGRASCRGRGGQYV